MECLLLWRISILGEAFKQERVRKKINGGGGGQRVLKRFRSHNIKIHSSCEIKNIGRNSSLQDGVWYSDRAY